MRGEPLRSSFDRLRMNGGGATLLRMNGCGSALLRMNGCVGSSQQHRGGRSEMGDMSLARSLYVIWVVWLVYQGIRLMKEEASASG